MSINYNLKHAIFGTLLCCAVITQAQPIQQLKDSAATFPAMPRGTADMIPFVQGLPTFASGAPFNDLDFTIIDTDYIDGENSGGDVFLPVDPSDALPGSNKVKYIRCVLNTDLNANYQCAKWARIILGTAEIAQPFFLRGSDGLDNDYAVIQHFDFQEGYVQLRGAISDYALVYCTTDEGCQTTGWYLFYIGNDDIDLIAFVFPCWDIESSVSGNPPNNTNPLCYGDSTLSLSNPAQFRFAQAIETSASIPQAISQFGSTGKEVIGGFTVDDEGNSYLLGCTDSNLDGLTDAPNELFVSKISEQGQVLWTTELAMTEGSILKAGVTDEQYVYVAGRTLGNLPGFTNAGRWDGILLKLDRYSGQIVQMNQWGNSGIDGYGNITLDDDGNLFVSAQGSQAGTTSTDNDYLVAKHRCSDLSNVWRQLRVPNAMGFIASAEAWGGLTYVPSGVPGVGRLVAGGWYFGPQGANAFVSVYEDLHTLAPTRPHSIIINTPGARADWVLDNAVDASGNIYVAGFTSGNLQGQHQGEGDAYIIKYSPQLTNPVIRQFGTPKCDLVRKLQIDANGIVYAIGYTYGNFDGSLNADVSLSSADVFVQKFDADLEPLGSLQFGTPHEERAFGVIRGNLLYIGGITEGSLKAPNLGSFDGFVLRLNSEDLSYNAGGTVGLQPSPIAGGHSLHPNPANDQLFITSANGRPIGTIRIFSADGRVVREHGRADTNRVSLDLQGLKPGVYTVSCNDGTVPVALRFVKE